MKLVILLACCASLFGQPTVDADHNGNSRLAAVDETALTPANVASAQFGKLGTISLSGKPYGQVLYIPQIVVAGLTRNVIFSSDNTNRVYAHDADTFASLWTTAALDTPCTSTCTGFRWGLNYGDPVGIQSTPGIDVAQGFVFVVTRNNTPVLKLWKLNLLTGATIGSGLPLSATYSPSTASDAVATVLTFDPAFAQQRAGLTVANGNVYIATASVRDVAPWHGWIFARAESDLSTVASVCTNCNKDGGGIWQSGRGLAVDASGNIYAVTGNCGIDTATYTSCYNGTTDLGMSVLKYSSTLSLLASFTPSDYAAQNAIDTDLGSSGPLLIPNPASPGNYLISTGGKNFKGYAIRSQCMGGLGGTNGGCTAPQELTTGSDPGTHMGIYGSAHMNGVTYLSNTAGPVYAFTLLNTGLYNPTPISAGSVAFPGAIPSGSSNGAANGVIWTLSPDASTLVAPSTGTLVALNATTLAEIWRSSTSGRNAVGNIQKFLPPTVANGKVYVPTYDGKILIYGVNYRNHAIIAGIQ